MIKSTYDYIILGKSFPSLLYGIDKLLQGQSVIIVDDSTINMGDNFIGHISEAEILWIENKFKSLNLPFKKELFFQKMSNIIYLNDVLIEFGDDPYFNLLEIFRKVSFFDKEISDQLIFEIKQEDFNQFIFDLIQKSANNLNFEIFAYLNQFNNSKEEYNLVNKFLLELIRKIQLKQKELSQFFYSLQINYQCFFSNKVLNEEMIYLILMAISPVYKVNTIDLGELFLNLFKKLNGEICTASAKEWEFNKTKEIHLLLDSFEGLLKSKNVIYFGEIKDTEPFKLNFSNRIFKTLEYTFFIQHPLIQKMVNKKITISGQKELGTDHPFSIIEILPNNIITIKFTYALSIGTTDKYYKAKAIEYINTYLKKVFPTLKLDLNQDLIGSSKSKDNWIEVLYLSNKSDKKFDYSFHNTKKALRLKESDKVPNQLKYFGALISGDKGLLSYLNNLSLN